MLTLSHDNIEKIFADCFFKQEELPENPTKDNMPEGAITVEGTRGTLVFHGERTESHREEVKELLSQLDDNFMKEKGGGWSFLQMPFNKNGEQYGEQMTADMLYCVAAALGYAKFALPREMWLALPGSMPYIEIDLSDKDPGEKK